MTVTPLPSPDPRRTPREVSQLLTMGIRFNVDAGLWMDTDANYWLPEEIDALLREPSDTWVVLREPRRECPGDGPAPEL